MKMRTSLMHKTGKVATDMGKSENAHRRSFKKCQRFIRIVTKIQRDTETRIQKTNMADAYAPFLNLKIEHVKMSSFYLGRAVDRQPG